MIYNQFLHLCDITVVSKAKTKQANENNFVTWCKLIFEWKSLINQTSNCIENVIVQFNRIYRTYAECRRL